MITRRSAIGSCFAAALLAGARLPHDAAARRKPPRLRPGDTVGLVAPAGFVADRFGLAEVEQTIRAMGLVPKLGRHLLDRHGYLAGTDEQRAADLNAMFADDDVRAIFAVRGGWGSARVLPFLDYAAIDAHPKLLIGSSDITALHLALAAKTGNPSIHGPNVVHSWSGRAWEAFHSLAFEAELAFYDPRQEEQQGLGRREPSVRTFRPGKARGRLLGGNLSILCGMVGTPYLPDFDGAILFLEDTNEAEYRIDRLLTQLGQSGLLGQVAGVAFGQCTNCRNPGSPYSNFTLYEVLDHHLAPLGVPAFQGARIGHVADQISIPVGIEAEIDASRGTIRILEPVVA